MKKSNNLPNDIQVLRFLKCINSGDRFVQLSFEIPGKKSPAKKIIPMSIVNTNDIVDYLPAGYVMKFPSKREQARDDEKIIFYYDKKYFFRGEAMHAYLKQHFVDLSSKKLSSILKNAGLLCTRKKELSYKLPKELRKKFGLGDTRYYRVYSNVLDSLVADRCDNIIELFGSHLYKYQ